MDSKESKKYLRPVRVEDKDILLRWANDVETRKNSFSTHIISSDEHEKWFDMVLRSSDISQYIMMDESTAVGQIRADIDGEKAEISYSIAHEYRGNGYGTLIIELMIEMIKEDHPNVNSVVARVKPENKASIACFQKNDFEEKCLEYERVIR